VTEKVWDWEWFSIAKSDSEPYQPRAVKTVWLISSVGRAGD
jgi:hypothetical protein